MHLILVTLMASVLAAGPAGAQPAPLIQGPLPIDPNLTVSMIVYDAPPEEHPTTIGQQGHRHAAAVYAYVASGEVLSRLGDGPERRYRAGEAWAELPGEAHYIVNASASEAARVVVVFIAPKRVSRLTEQLPPLK